MKSIAPERLSGLRHAMLILAVCQFAGASALPSTPSAGIHIQGPGVTPQLMFACCDHGVAQMQSLFVEADVVADLKNLHAGLAVAVSDFSPERAAIVRRLNQAGIPLIAVLTMAKEQGFYFNAENATLAAAGFAAFDAWSREQGLKWDGVGLDIEPNFAELATLRSHPWRLVTTFLWRAVDLPSTRRARRAYSTLIANMRGRNYFVQTYALPFLPVERRTGSSLLDRLLGTVDVRGDQEVLMLYTSYAGPVGAAIIWKLGPVAQAIAIGVTDGDPGANPAVLNWNRFTRDLIVASHFSHLVGVYNLEGCVRQGFLSRLQTMDWNQSVTIPAEAIQKANHRLWLLGAVLRLSSHFLYLAGVFLLAITLAAWRRRIRNRKRIS
jgi:hypothetical protein